ncbi:Uncharacterised protein [Klebsiella pneumoniae]|nr:Uncharacterised protein [Klebsiella pneumoniae]
MAARPGRFSGGRRRRLHQRRHPEQPDGPDAGARRLLRPSGPLHPAGWAAGGYPQVQSLVLGKRPLLGAEEHGADGPRLPLGNAGENRRIRADGRVRPAGEDCASAG